MVGTGNILAQILGQKEETYVLCLVIRVLCLQCVHCELAALSVVGKPAAQSTDHGVEYTADKAVDGKTWTFSHTADGSFVTDPHPWWRVDLETDRCLGKITVTLRQDCCGLFRFTGTVVGAGGSQHYFENPPCGLPATTGQSSDGAVNDFLCDPPRMARYVTLDIDPSRPSVTAAVLQLAEVRVEEYTSGECFENALDVLGKPAIQSSDQGAYPPENAVDGNINTFSHTAPSGDPHPWLRVDLETEHCLGSITVALRRICCGQNRFAGTQVRAGNSPNYAENQPCGLPATRAQSVTASVNNFQCDPPRMARYITLDIDTSQPIVTKPILQIAEISVEEYIPGECLVKNDFAFKYNSANFKMLFKGGLIGNQSPLLTRVAKSLSRCAAFCISHAECNSFDFSSSSSQCHLHSLGSADIETAPNDDFSVYVCH